MTTKFHPGRWAVYAVHADGTKNRLTRYTDKKPDSEARLNEMLGDPWWQELKGRMTDGVELQVLQGDYQT